MKTAIILIGLSVGLYACKQAPKSIPETPNTETVSTLRQYEYADAAGKRVIIKNSLPKGAAYTAPDGKVYFRIIFWTQIVNETEHTLEFNINFPAKSYEVSALPGKYFKLLLPPDTMTFDKDPLLDYGMKDLKLFLDNNIDKSSSLKRTIKPKESSGFYVLLLSQTTQTTPGSTFRTGLSLKGQNLIYRISQYASKAEHPLISEEEINCGSINLNDLVPQK